VDTKFGPAADVDWPVLRWYLLLILVSFLALLGRLLYLQILSGSELKLASLNNVIRDVPIPAPRGEIYDRKGHPLAVNSQRRSLMYIMPREISKYFLSDGEVGLLTECSQAELERLDELGNREFSELSAWAASETALLDKAVTWLIALRPFCERYGQPPLALIQPATEQDQEQPAYAPQITAEYIAAQVTLLRSLGEEPLLRLEGQTTAVMEAYAQDPSAQRTASDYHAREVGLLSELEQTEQGWLQELTINELYAWWVKRHDPEVQQQADELVRFYSAATLGLQGDLPQARSWAREFTVSELKWLAQAQGNPARLPLVVREATREAGQCAYLYWGAASTDASPDDPAPGKSLAEVQRLAEYLQVPYTELMEQLETESKRIYGYQPALLVEELTSAQVVYLAENQEDYPSALIEEYASRRDYPMGELASHLVGYTGLVTENDPQSIKELGYGPRELVGKEGVERGFEHLLHGVPGQRDIEVDRARAFQGVVRLVPPERGNDIYLTIDKEVQAKCQQLIGDRRGAIIVSSLLGGEGSNQANDYRGEIIALASGPSYDANRFNERGYYASLIADRRLPLLNRTYRHAFPPGSVFKLVTATTGMQAGKFSAGSGFYCRGYIELGRYKQRFYCHRRTGHEALTMIEAISESCDVAFYQIGLGLGNDAPELLKRYAKYFSYGAPVGISLPGEVKGILPDKAWKRRNYSWATEADRLWYDGDTVNYAIGQGFLTATPLQVLWSANVVALDGWWAPPRLLKAKVVDGEVSPAEHEEIQRLPLEMDALQTVQQGMRLAVTTGTCKRLNVEGMAVCAKSGTAEAGRDQEDHSWVVGYYPYQQPRYSFVAFFENAGGAGDAAIPAARELLLFLKNYEAIELPPG